MNCDKCKGIGKVKSYNDYDLECGESKCNKCEGSGILTSQQELDYTLLHMQTHEEYRVDDCSFVLRVIGGWIYNYYSIETGNITSSVFVKDYRLQVF